MNPPNILSPDILQVMISTPLAMHISEGILSPLASISWYLLMLPALAYGISQLKRLSKDDTIVKPILGLVGACVFIFSCMPVPIPLTGTCSHPCGTGLAAIILGPALTVVISSIALLFQAIFLAHGGITSLGSNIFSMGIVGGFSAYLTWKAFRRFGYSLPIAAFFSGLIADWATYTATALQLSLAIHGNESWSQLFFSILVAFSPTQIPLGIIEGFVTAGIIRFIAIRKPEILGCFNHSNSSVTRP